MKLFTLPRNCISVFGMTFTTNSYYLPANN